MGEEPLFHELIFGSLPWYFRFRETLFRDCHLRRNGDDVVVAAGPPGKPDLTNRTKGVAQSYQLSALVLRVEADSARVDCPSRRGLHGVKLWHDARVQSHDSTRWFAESRATETRFAA